ncbi:unnamed protein product, partial [Meganyctiphanes norvegica]
VLVTGSRLELSCDPTSARVSHILQAVMEVENFPLPHLFGLAVLGSGEFHFVAPQTKLHKVAPPGWKERHPTKDGLMQDNFTLHLRIMYYLRFSNVHKLDVLTRRLIYLQLRHDLLEGRLPLPRHSLLNIAALALQAEFGDNSNQEAGYFLLEHYLSESVIRGSSVSQLMQELQELHRANEGMHYSQAAISLIARLQDLPYYGTHYYHVTQDKGRQQWWLGISGSGVLILAGPPSPETLATAALHPWPSVKRLSYASHRLTI